MIEQKILSIIYCINLIYHIYTVVIYIYDIYIYIYEIYIHNMSVYDSLPPECREVKAALAEQPLMPLTRSKLAIPFVGAMAL